MSSMHQPDRLTAILGHPEAVGREALADHLAKATAMTVEQAVAALACSARSGAAGSTGAAAAAGAAVARALMGLPPDPAGDLALGKQAADAHAVDITNRARAEAGAAKFQEEFAEGQESARRLLGCRH